jgi:hypothetical protein
MADAPQTAGSKPLANRVIALSISDTPDLARLGMADDEDTRILGALLTPLVFSGARIAYGGRIRPTARTNFTLEVSTQLAEAYRRTDIQLGRRPMIHYLRSRDAHREGPDALFAHVLRLGAASEIRLLSGETSLASLLPKGRIVDVRLGGRALGVSSPGELAAIPELAAIFANQPPNDLPGMRTVMARETDARVLLGGRVSDTLGGVSGVVDEGLATLDVGKPLLIVGAAGGSSREAGGALGLVDAADLVQRDDAEYFDDQKRPSKDAYLGQLGQLTARRDAFRQRAERDGTWLLLRRLAVSESYAEIGTLIVDILGRAGAR